MAITNAWARRSKVAVAASIAVGLAMTGCAAESGEQPESSITFWHYWTDRADLLQELATQYEDETGVVVNLELVPGDALGQKFQAAAQADTLPDISAGWVGASEELAAYALEGQVLNLSELDDADSWFERFDASTMQGVTYLEGNQWGVDPGAYLVPFDTTNMQILYNKDLFDEAGIDSPPTNLDEFVAASDKLRDAGVQPFVSGFSSWPLQTMAMMYIDNIVPLDVRDAAYSGEGRYDTPEWVEFLETFETLTEAGVFADGILGYDMPAAETLFTSGQAGMIFDGSWALGVFNQINPDFKNYGVFLPPSLGDEPLYLSGGVGSMAFVVGTSPQAKEATAFLEWMTDSPQQKKYAEGSFNIPANKEVADQVELDENIAAFAAGSDQILPPSTVAMQAPVITTMVAGIQLIIAGTDTPESVAAKMQKALESGQPQ